MARYRTTFELKDHTNGTGQHCGIVEIQELKSYRGVKVTTVSGRSYYMKPKELEMFAVNLLKSIKSKRLL